jgi:hypothetical protein
MKGKIFNAQEVQSIISGNKTQFREVIKVQPPTYIKNVNFAGQGTWEWGNSGVYVEEPYQKGQKIFCKESFNIFADQVVYKQSLANAERYIWKPAQQMKQEQSRLTLQIKEIRVERLRSIRQEDCLKEWIDIDTDYANLCVNIESHGGYENSLVDGSAIKTIFAKAWNATHKKPEEKFEANPFCWVISYEVLNAR